MGGIENVDNSYRLHCLLSEKLLSLIFSIYNITIHYKKLKEKKTPQIADIIPLIQEYP
jgi:hypothetical protein